jgi:hypothetical protein
LKLQILQIHSDRLQVPDAAIFSKENSHKAVFLAANESRALMKVEPMTAEKIQ